MQSPALIAITRGPDHVYDFVNAASAEIHQRDVVGKSVREVFPETADSRIAILDRVYRTGERHVAREIPEALAYGRDGRPHDRFFNIVYEPYRGPRGEIEGIMSFGFEVTEQILARRKVETIIEELENASRTKDEFLATVSHELRTPLTSILGWIRMLRSHTLPADRKERALETIERNARAQAQLIEDLLDVSRIISGKVRLDVSDVNLVAVLENAMEAVKPAATAKGVLLQYRIDPNAGGLIGDPDRLQQVVWNLLTNAVKFTPKGGSIEASVDRRDGAVEIAVRDTGQGIAPEFLPYVFERFRQADASTTRQHGGLGLAIVRHLVELHGGVVSVRSDGVGEGATFLVSLPVAPSSCGAERIRSVPSDSERAIAPRELQGVHVLVVDDDPDARDLLAETLYGCRSVVSTAANVDEALRMVREKMPQLVVSDIGMPGRDGYDLIRQLRALPLELGGATPAVALTAYARVQDRTKALAAGFNMHVAKPVEPDELVAALVSLVPLITKAPSKGW
jgi:signal transduction histidine kinase/CheY-like chemotaxis protein